MPAAENEAASGSSRTCGAGMPSGAPSHRRRRLSADGDRDHPEPFYGATGGA